MQESKLEVTKAVSLLKMAENLASESSPPSSNPADT